MLIHQPGISLAERLLKIEGKAGRNCEEDRRNNSPTNFDFNCRWNNRLCFAEYFLPAWDLPGYF